MLWPSEGAPSPPGCSQPPKGMLQPLKGALSPPVGMLQPRRVLLAPPGSVPARQGLSQPPKGASGPPGYSQPPKGVLWPSKGAHSPLRGCSRSRGCCQAPQGAPGPTGKCSNPPRMLPSPPGPARGPAGAVPAWWHRGCGSPWASLQRPSLRPWLRHRMTKGSSQGAGGRGPSPPAGRPVDERREPGGEGDPQPHVKTGHGAPARPPGPRTVWGWWVRAGPRTRAALAFSGGLYPGSLKIKHGLIQFFLQKMLAFLHV